jgi:HlyD family secretion protein
LYAEALVSEADIASVVVGQSIDNTFDALGPYEHFESKVLVVNPASTVVSGVVNYKVIGSLENIPNIKPGMTANMTILVAEKKGVLTVSSSAIINKEDKRYVRVVDDTKTKTFHEVEVTTGLEADSGLTEILSGLTEGQEVVTYIK